MLTQIGMSFVVAGKSQSARHAVFKCQCGSYCIKTLSNGRSKRTKSCGCVKRVTDRAPKYSSHGMSRTKVYRAWAAMKDRCTNDKCKFFHHYGGRGIKVCERWMVFENFFEDMGVPEDGLTLDRRDNSAGYCKENCRWATITEQLRNTRANVVIEYQGKSQCVAAWAKDVGMKATDLHNRLKCMSFERAISTPIKRQRKRSNNAIP